MDAGERWMLSDVTGKPLYGWDSRGNLLRTRYDPLRRPAASALRNGSHPDWVLVTCTRFGDERGATAAWEAESRARNLRGQPYRSYDQSGLLTNVRFDFKGNLLEVRRRFALEYAGDTDWEGVQALEPDREPDGLLMDESFSQVSEYDALNRVTRQYKWHRGIGGAVAVVEPVYNVRGLLEREDLVLDARKTDGFYEGGTRTPMVRHIAYDAKGQREAIEYGNDSATTYSYDPETFRLVHLETRRHTDGRTVQALRYTYDPVGNITEIVDGAQPEVFFGNFRVEARNRYTYDALYRLTEAQGREHAGQATPGAHDNWHDCALRKRYHPNDAMAWRGYTERYRYDAVGNLLAVRHTAHGDTAAGWTRHYQYGQTNNRLLATGIGSAPVDPYPATPGLEYRYGYNAHGSMTSMPHLPSMEWDFTEHLRHIARGAGTQGEEGGQCPDTSLEAWYRYDSAKQRSRKRVLKQGGQVEERLYLGGLEVFRRYAAAGALTLERETLHVMDDKARVALVETRTAGSDDSLPRLIRFQYGNHLGSACLELDERENIVSYEEYYPYGGTSYQAVPDEAEIRTRYRYTGKERDEESGLYYHGLRFCAPWCGRWVSADPEQLKDGPNVYSYARNIPTRYTDPSGTHVTDNPQGRIGGIEEFLGGSGATGRYLFTRGGGWIDRDHLAVAPTIRALQDIDAGRPVVLENNGLTRTYTVPTGLRDRESREGAAISIVYDFLYRYEIFQESRSQDVLEICSNLVYEPGLMEGWKAAHRC